ncbi:unnamed protein product [Dovyalis caffra]|uniref:Uncharacterized protein n=1 Tax=Dovyalis caffra TaxID=77055 RepID=A0AAV1STZ6_9ROSI|nr:unnamed protein product [Dovyalis caffra]
MVSAPLMQLKTINSQVGNLALASSLLSDLERSSIYAYQNAIISESAFSLIASVTSIFVTTTLYRVATLRCSLEAKMTGRHWVVPRGWQEAPEFLPITATKQLSRGRIRHFNSKTVVFIKAVKSRPPINHVLRTPDLSIPIYGVPKAAPNN